MLDNIFGNRKEILEIAYNCPHFWRTERNLQKLHLIDHVFEGKKFLKLYMIDHVFEERREIPEIVYDSPRFWRREKNPEIAYDSPRLWIRERNF